MGNLCVGGRKSIKCDVSIPESPIEHAKAEVARHTPCEVAKQTPCEVGTQAPCKVAKQTPCKVAKRDARQLLPGEPAGKPLASEIAEQPACELPELPVFEIVEQPACELAELPVSEIMKQPACGLVGKLTPSDPVTETPDMSWFEAAERGLTSILQHHPLDIDQVNAQKSTALHLSVRGNHFKTVQWLLEAKAEMLGDKTKRTPLHHADSADIVNLLLAANAQANAVDLWRKTPLRCAIDETRMDCVGVLLEHTDVMKQDREGDTIFHAIARGANIAIGQLVFPKFASHRALRVTNSAGKSVLDVVEDNDMGSIAVAAGCTFVKRKADITAACALDHAYVAEYLFLHAAHVGPSSKQNILRPRGEPPLCIAVRHNALKTCRVLLAHNADVNAGRALLLAVSCGNEEVAQLLLDRAADVCATDTLRRTCLYLSLLHGHAPIASHLLTTYPALITVCDSGNRTIAHAAAAGGIVLSEIAPSIEVDQPGDYEGWRPWHVAAQHGHVRVLRAMALTDEDLFDTADFDLTCAHLAADGGHAEVLEFLMTRAFNARQMRGGDGKTPWLISAAGDHIGCLQTLGAEFIDDVDKDGRSALHLCGSRSAAWLVNNGASVHLRDNVGWTPLHLQAAEGREEVVDILLASKADATLVDEEGQTARKCAMMRRQLHVLSSLDAALRAT